MISFQLDIPGSDRISTTISMNYARQAKKQLTLFFSMGYSSFPPFDGRYIISFFSHVNTLTEFISTGIVRIQNADGHHRPSKNEFSSVSLTAFG